jgi:hypothetical protein
MVHVRQSGTIYISPNLVEKAEREVKVKYLMDIGLFKKEALDNMSDKEINDLIYTALEVKGFKK